MNTEFKGTKGLWSFEKDKEFPTLHNIWSDSESVFKKGTFIARTCYAPLSEYNAELIADAGNTIQSCGLLPSELLKQRDELKQQIELYKECFAEFIPLDKYDEATAFLSANDGLAKELLRKGI